MKEDEGRGRYKILRNRRRNKKNKKGDAEEGQKERSEHNGKKVLVDCGLFQGERELREQELSNLATEAELSALRAQINPHFLFNALTTISYLIQTAPEKALATLLQLTGLLRGVLRSTGEFQTLGEELKLIENYRIWSKQRNLLLI